MKIITSHLKKALVIPAIAMLLVSGAPYEALALKPDTTFNSLNNITWFDGDVGASASCNVGESSGSGSIAGVPEPWKKIISDVAPEYKDVDPRLVAATLYIENRGWPEYKEKGWATSSAGAQGPWQFMPASWASMGKDGSGDGVPDPNHPKDAVHGAFVHQKGSAGKPLIEGFSGDLAAGLNSTFKRDKKNLLSFMASYNGRGAPDGVKLKDFPKGDQNSDYVMMAYYVIGSDFTQTWDTSTGQPKPITSGGASRGSEPADSTINSCEADMAAAEMGAVNTNGMAFPLGVPKSKVSYGYGKLPCTRNSCHHDNSYAFDLFADPGTPVYAIEDGKIQSLKDRYDGNSGCFSIQFAAKSGWIYWYGHIRSPSVRQGQNNIKAGQKLAVVGESRCARDTAPHLHIDRGSPKGRTGGEDCCRDKGINQVINSLYEGMPG